MPNRLAPQNIPGADQQPEPIVIVTTCDDLEAMSPETREAFIHMVQLAIKAVQEGTLGKKQARVTMTDNLPAADTETDE